MGPMHGLGAGALGMGPMHGLGAGALGMGPVHGLGAGALGDASSRCAFNMAEMPSMALYLRSASRAASSMSLER